MQKAKPEAATIDATRRKLMDFIEDLPIFWLVPVGPGSCRALSMEEG
jgi:hypothetical protein